MSEKLDRVIENSEENGNIKNVYYIHFQIISF